MSGEARVQSISSILGQGEKSPQLPSNSYRHTLCGILQLTGYAKTFIF